MPVEQVAQTYYRRSQTHQRSVVAALLALWQQSGPSGFRDVIVQAAGLLAAGQLVAAVNAARYVSDIAAEYDLEPTPLQVNPRGFAGSTAAGRSLTDVLGAPVARVWTEIDLGGDFQTATRSGELMLTRLVSNEVAQSGVDAVQAGIVADPGMGGYVRMVQAPACGRCAILAGKWFEFNDGFDRHPGCDCVHVPAGRRAEAMAAMTPWSTNLVDNPKSYFDSLSAAEQNRQFGAAVADKIRDGADVIRAVNQANPRPARSRRTPTARSRTAAVRQLQSAGLLTGT